MIISGTARRKKENEFPVPINLLGGTLLMPLADADVVTTPIMPGNGWIGASTLLNSNPGTGTALLTVTWRDAAAGGGTALTGEHRSATGGLVDLDAGGASYSAKGTMLPINGVPEGSRLFMFADLDAGSASAGGSWECTILLVL